MWGLVCCQGTRPKDCVCVRQSAVGGGTGGAHVTWAGCDHGRWQVPTGHRHRVLGSQGPKRTVERKGMVWKWTLRGSW